MKVTDDNEKAKSIQEDEAAVKARLEEEKKKREKEVSEYSNKSRILCMSASIILSEDK